MVITVGRQYGSGGREIGTALANRLGIAYYDDLLLKKAAEESGREGNRRQAGGPLRDTLL